MARLILNEVVRKAYGSVPAPIGRILGSNPWFRQHLSFDYWLRRYESRGNANQVKIEIAGFTYRPTVSVVMPTYNTPLELLDKAIDSVCRQYYSNWELCICDDASRTSAVRERLEHWRKRDSRIRLAFLKSNEGIVGASNRALEMATGEFVGFLDHDDELTPDALFEIVKLLQTRRDVAVIYSDEDKLTSEGRRVQPFFKPDWSPEFMLNFMYVCHFCVYRRELLEKLGGFRPQFSGAQDYDLFLRATELSSRIEHVPKILYHWRITPDSTSGSNAKPYAFNAGREALSDHLKRNGVVAEVSAGPDIWMNWVRFKVGDINLFSIAILVGGQKGRIRDYGEKIRKMAGCDKCEIVEERRDSRQHSSIIINRVVRRTSNEYVMILYDTVEAISGDWLGPMLGHCRQKDIAVVGAKLLSRSGYIQHIGIVLGLRGIAGFPLHGLREYKLGPLDPSHLVRNCSAVSGLCMMVKRSVFDQVGGFDEELTGEYAAIDFCLKARNAGYRIVWTPHAEFYYDGDEGALDDERQVALLKQRWGKLLERDPYYNPNLTLKHVDMGYRL